MEISDWHAGGIDIKKVFVAIVLIMVIGLFSFLIAAPIVNDNMAEKTANELADLPLPDNTEYMESVYQAGKLVGNGNGMQYFGAVLIKSGLSLEELKDYYSSYAENEWKCVVENQNDTDIKVIEHAKLTFDTNIDGEDYFIVYSWGDNNTIFHEFDIRGH